MKQIEEVLKLMHEYKAKTNKPLKRIKMSDKTFAAVRKEFDIVSASKNPEFNGAVIEFCTEAEEDRFYQDLL
jgi:hypothetical protein